MGRTVYWMNVSMDLRIEHVPDEQGGGKWMRIGDELHQEFNDRARRLSAMVQGRVIYETMESFWPKAADDATMPAILRDYGRIWTDKPKILVSRTRREAGHNTRCATMDELVELLGELPGDVGVGGATVATELLGRGLLDELLLFIHPVILGGGRPLFDDDHLVECDLVESATFPEGVVMHRYTIRK